MSEWREAKRKNIDPAGTLQNVEQELDSQFLRLGNDWTGRGVVMDAVIAETIEAVEIVRSDLLTAMKQGNSKPENHNTGKFK